MLNLVDVKAYLRVDYDDDDNLLSNMIASADAYLHAAVDDYDKYYAEDSRFKSVADDIMLSIVNERYTNRDAFLENQKGKWGASFLLKSMILQLQTWGATNDRT